MKNLVAVCHTVWAKFGVMEPHSLGIWIVPTLMKHAPPPHVTVPNLVPLGQTVWTYAGVPKLLGTPLRWDGA